MASTFRFITFLSDYGLEDEFVGVCRGVVKRFAPDVEILDIAHGIPPQDVSAGATVLAQAVKYMPAAVHLAIVDPGVGTPRRAVVVETAAGSPLVGPDNGVLWLATEALGGATRAFAITNQSLFLEAPSRTFHGRDIFAPVAARIALGMDPHEVGEECSVDGLIRIDMPPAKVDDDHIHARVVQIDHFGNLQLNFGRSELEGIGVILGDATEVRVGGRSFSAPYSQAFSEVKKGGLILLEDSHRHLTLAVNMGNARDVLEARRGDPVIIARVQVAGN
ncbi:MAG TPA: SAM-dependent chlorinase/fluorinase [Actinomycetota bacterium]|nr:SAM-dependent chlorinase/fluorinase [Actinomycetota bacterium]